MNTLTVYPGESIAAAVSRARTGDIIRIKNGTYREKLLIDKAVTLCGESRDKCVITFDDYAKKLHADGREYNTFRTWTAAVVSDNVKISNLTISNGARSPAEKGQAVALTLYGDRIEISNCNLLSMQDTVFCGPLPPDLIARYADMLPDCLRLWRPRPARQRFFGCLIAGSVDFIFGCADAVFDCCEIRSVADGRDVGYIAAPAHSKDDSACLSFVGCRMTCDGVRDGTVYLARPWRDYGAARFLDCSLGRHISPLCFDKWNDTDRDRTARFALYSRGFDSCVPWARRLTKTEGEELISKAKAMFAV